MRGLNRVGTSSMGCYWFTGLSGAGKTTLANSIKQKLDKHQIRCVVLDGDVFRATLNSDLGFDRESRRENVRRIAEVAKMFLDSGVVVLVASIAPYRQDRQAARDRFCQDQFFEVFVNTPFEVCRYRDPKGLYAGMKDRVKPNFTGFDAPYEIPISPEFTINTISHSVEDCGRAIIDHVIARGRSAETTHIDFSDEQRLWQEL